MVVIWKTYETSIFSCNLAYVTLVTFQVKVYLGLSSETFKVASHLSLLSRSPPSSAASDYDPLNPVEKQALLDFINMVPHPSFFNWNQSQPACTWKGITCDPDGVTVLYLRLPTKSLVGQIPPNTIGKLTSLRVLSLRYNGLSGEIPSDFSNLTYLTTLYLSYNNFSGNIPSAFSTLPYLTRLMLNNNSFSGNLPDFINGQDLTTFNVSYNKLVGRIPRSLSQFPLSAFSYNTYLCGPPTPIICNSSYPPPKSDEEPTNTSTVRRRAIFGIYSGSTMVLLILFGSVGKKMYQHIIPPSDLMEKKKLVTFEDNDFKLEDLLKTNAELLGKGSLATSYKQVHKEKDRTVVLKILKDVVVTEVEFETKMNVLGAIKNKYVVPLRAFYSFPNNEKLLVYDYMTAGSLSDRLHGSTASIRTQFYWDRRMHIALNAARGLACLHEVEIVHGNITSSNIFLQHETSNEVSLSDYGLNTLYHGSSSLNHRVTGYWAPEVLKTLKFTSKSDVYSFGVLLLELLTRKIPNTASFDKERVHFSDWVSTIVCKEPKVELFDVELSKNHNIDKLVELAKECVLIAPDERPQMCDVVSRMEEMLSRQSSDYKLKGYNDRPSLMETSDTLSTITLDTP
ncbi:putative protein kinase RLK-Pelle-LRR-III family [Helianthus debilis subsp. tardiflorus]